MNPCGMIPYVGSTDVPVVSAFSSHLVRGPPYLGRRLVARLDLLYAAA